jgi:hypothetical protein
MASRLDGCNNLNLSRRFFNVIVGDTVDSVLKDFFTKINEKPNTLVRYAQVRQQDFLLYSCDLLDRLKFH